MKRLIIIATLAILILIPMVSADAANFSQIVGNDLDSPMNENVRVNISYQNDKTGATPIQLWWFTAVLGLGLLIGSFICKPEQCNDFMAYLAPWPLLLAAWMSLRLDVLGGYGVAALSGYVEQDVLYKWVLLEQHTIYHHELLAILLFVFFIGSLANIARVYAQHRELKLGENQ